MIRKYAARAVSSVLALILAFTALPSAADAESADTSKEEVVYVNLNFDGTVKEINVVNIFSLAADGEIVDYGDYKSVRNMTTTDKIDYSDGKISVNAKTGKLYYEGKLDSDLVPWSIVISYYLDGERLTADELAGKSGKLKICVKVAKNTKCGGDFFENYALQGVISLDADLCKNIVAEGATVANVGKSKQLTYTVLPGGGLDAVITADVTDFETEGFSFNGIPLNLSINIDDEELLSRVSELLSAIGLIDDGAEQLKEGIFAVKNGAEDKLKNGQESLKSGAEEEKNGAGRLKDGIAALEDGAAGLKSSAAVLDGGAKELQEGIDRINRALEALNEQSPALSGGCSQFNEALLQLKASLPDLSAEADRLTSLISASEQIMEGADSLANGAEALLSAAEFDAFKKKMAESGLDIDALKQNNSAGAESLQKQIAALNAQIAALQAEGKDASELLAQSAQLQSLAYLLSLNNAAIDGFGAYLDALNDNIAELSVGAKTLASSYAAFHGSICGLVDELSGVTYKLGALSSAVGTLVSEYEKLGGGISAYTDGVAQIAAGFVQITDGAAALAAGSGAIKLGADGIYGGVGALLGGASELYDGAFALYEGAGSLESGVDELINGLDALFEGAGKLELGTSALRSGTDGLDSEITEKIGGLLDAVSGGNTKPRSFVSEKNGGVEAVQFVMKAGGVKAVKADLTAPAVKKKLTLWQRILKLFGLYRED